MKNGSGKLGWLAVWVLALIPVFLWLFSMPLASRVATSEQVFLSLGQVAALVGTALFAITLMLSARLKVFERFFHGLNEVYDRHNQLGQIALILLLFHPLLLLPQYAGSIGDAASFLLPGVNWAKNWGGFSLGLMIVLLVLTLYLKPRYDIWKWTHKFLGLALFLGGLHVFLIPSDVSRFLPLRFYMLSLVFVALIAFAYRTILGMFLVERLSYEVSAVKRLNVLTYELVLKPVNETLKFAAGQFLFLQFVGGPLGGESHPFSIVSSPGESELRLIIKNLGDYTSRLDELKKGQVALVEGPFGAFNYHEGKSKKQVWIAGGIGITPFIPMLDSLKSEDSYDVDLFYCVKHDGEALYHSELVDVAAKLNREVKVHLQCSEKDGRINAEYIKKIVDSLQGRDFFICAPPVMINALKKQFIDQGVSANMIHSEEFNF